MMVKEEKMLDFAEYSELKKCTATSEAWLIFQLP